MKRIFCAGEKKTNSLKQLRGKEHIMKVYYDHDCDVNLLKKKNIVIKVLKLVILNDTPNLNAETKQLLLSMMNTTVPKFIDTAVGLVKGEIDIKKEWNKYFSTCCPCLPIEKKETPKPKK